MEQPVTRTLRLKPDALRRLSSGHLWVFSNEIQGFDRSIPPGEDVLVEDHRGRLVGSGTFNPHSLIAVRLHSPGREEPLDAALIRARIAAALERRRRWLGPGDRACRAVYGEADGLPGLVVDRFDAHLSVQILTAAMDRRTPAVLEALDDLLAPEGTVLRNDAPARRLEGLPLTVDVRGRVPERVPFELGGLRLAADLVRGQKTGFFFDQRDNYRLIRPLSPGARVLDAFCHTGVWGLAAARWGAADVTWLDASRPALDLVRANAGANGLPEPRTVCAEALEYLKAAAPEAPFDLAIVDPPAFAKSRRRVPEALRGYLNLNKWAMRSVRPGGHLVTCSCSHHVRPEVFAGTVARAARAAGRTVRVVGWGRQGPDHPWLPAMPETAYLKVLLLQVD